MRLVFGNVPRLAVARDGKEGVFQVHVVVFVVYGTYVKVVHMLKHALALVHGERLLEIDVSGLVVKGLRAVKAYEYAVVVPHVQYVGKARESHVRAPRGEHEHDAVRLRGHERVACARGYLFLVVGKRAVYVQQNGLNHANLLECAISFTG